MKCDFLAVLTLKFDSTSTVPMPGWFWVLAVPCVAFVLFLVVDGFVVRIKKRRLYKLQVPTNEISTFGPVAAHSASSYDSKRKLMG